MTPDVQGNVVLIAFYEIDSLAVCTLHAVLRRAGISAFSIFFKQLNPNNTMDPETEEEMAALIGLLKDLKPILVGLSVRSTYFRLAVRVSKRIRRELNTFVLWGGVHVTICPESCLEHCDAICIGEGEGAIVDLVGALVQSKPIEGIANLWLCRNGQVIKNEQRPLIADLDSLPFPDFLNDHKYLIDRGSAGSPPQEQRTFYWIMTARGCPYFCTYCCNNVLRRMYRGKGSYVRRRSVDNVLEELVQAKNNFPRLSFVGFEDDVFTVDIKWITAFAKRYREEVGVAFFCYCHPKLTNEAVIALLKEAGAVTMTMGIQSGSPKIRNDYFERNDTNEEIVQAARILAAHGIHCAYDVILDNPLETEDDRRQTLELLLRLPRPFELHTHSLTHFPGTKLTSQLLEQGLIRREDVEDIKQMSYQRWTPSLDLRRSRENLFWDNLYYMASKQDIPKGVIRWLSQRYLLKRFPRPLTSLLRLTSTYVQTVQAGSRWDWVRVRLTGRVLEFWRRLRGPELVTAKLRLIGRRLHAAIGSRHSHDSTS